MNRLLGLLGAGRWVAALGAVLADWASDFATIPAGTALTPIETLRSALQGIVAEHPSTKVILAAMFLPLQGLYQTLGDNHRLTRVHRAILNGLHSNEIVSRSSATRVSVLQLVTGIEAFFVFWWRWTLYEDEKLRVLPMAPLPWPWAKYLVVTARSSSGRNAQSCSMFRMYEANEARSQSLLRLIWESDARACHNALTGRARVERYARLGLLARWRSRREQWVKELREASHSQNFSRVAQLCAIKHLTPSLIGTVLRDSNGERWGVLVIDSDRSEGPEFEGVEASLRQLLAECSTQLSHTLIAEER